MKKVFFAAALAVAAGFAQAVTLTWSTGAVTSTQTGNISSIGDSFSLALVTTTNFAGLGGGSNLPLAQVSAATTTTVLAYSASDGIGSQAGSYWSAANSGSTSGTHSVVMNFTKSDSNFAVALFIDGTQVSYQANLTASINAFDTTNVVFNANSSNYWSTSSAAIYDGALDAAQIANITTSGDARKALSVPEPTVLALIALGVAGLALKRRA